MEQRKDSKGEMPPLPITAITKRLLDTWPVATYLAAITAANLVSARFGPAASIFNAFVFIGFDLTCRDMLHEAWERKHIVIKMGALIAAGSAISYGINRDAGTIAIASMVAFAVSASIDAFIYALLKGQARMLRINGSNVASALTDSVIFPTLAFGGFLPLVTLGQFVAKVIGGFIWSRIICRRMP
jgi:queuosine precursor transporter